MKTIIILILSSLFITTVTNADITSVSRTRSTAAVTLAGAILKVKHSDDTKKYPRKDCPVCKGQGWYWSGDGIKKVDCGYCIPDKGKESSKENKISINCQDGSCEPKSILRR